MSSVTPYPVRLRLLTIPPVFSPSHNFNCRAHIFRANIFWTWYLEHEWSLLHCFLLYFTSNCVLVLAWVYDRIQIGNAVKRRENWSRDGNRTWRDWWKCMASTRHRRAGSRQRSWEEAEKHLSSSEPGSGIVRYGTCSPDDWGGGGRGETEIIDPSILVCDKQTPNSRFSLSPSTPQTKLKQPQRAPRQVHLAFKDANIWLFFFFH